MFLLIATHIILSAIYFLWWFQRNKEESVYRLMIAFFMPGVGLILLILADILLTKKIRIKKIEPFEMEMYIPNESFLKTDPRKEINIVPFEEALILNSGSMKRKFIIETLKKDIEECIEILGKALHDEDAETSHYAASAIMEIRRRLTIALQELGVKYEKDKNDLATAAGYAAVLKKYLGSKLLDELSYMKYLKIYVNVLKSILNRPDAGEQYYIDSINCDLDLKEYSEAQKWCDLFLKTYPCSEDAYLMKIKLYYTLRDKKKFDQILREFKKSGIIFSNQALKTVRYWSEVE